MKPTIIATVLFAVLSLSAAANERCATGTLMDVRTRTERVQTFRTYRSHGKTHTVPAEERRTVYTLDVSLDGMRYSAQSRPILPPFSYAPTDLVVGDAIEGCVDGGALWLTRPTGAKFKTEIVRTERIGEAKPRPLAFERSMAARIDAYVAELMQRTHVPGLALGIVKDGTLVYAKGYGVRKLGGKDAVTPDTMMMIGSTGKSMTTMMMATLVDDGVMGWDTPAVKIDPAFAVSDPALTPRVRMRDLVCNCSGVQRHDLEMLFARRKATAREVVASVRDFRFIGEFGKTFGYVNQMVASGGYIAAEAAAPGEELHAGYLRQMQARVFDPIGMTRTTFSFERVLADGNFAAPHGATAGGEYVPLPIEAERLLEPYAPAGGSWSTVNDLARYLVTQLNDGVSPDAKRVVSSANLLVTRAPNVEVMPGAHYGLGWGIADYHGLEFVTHAGGTNGFSSDLTFLPEAGVGVIVLTNAQNANALTSAARSGALDLLFGRPIKPREGLTRPAPKTANVDRGAAAALAGHYTNKDLGEITIGAKDDKLFFAAGQFNSEMRKLEDGRYLVWDPPLAGTVVKVTGSSVSVIGNDPEQPDEWPFKRIDAQ